MICVLFSIFMVLISVLYNFAWSFGVQDESQMIWDHQRHRNQATRGACPQRFCNYNEHFPFASGSGPLGADGPERTFLIVWLAYLYEPGKRAASVSEISLS